MSVPDLEHIVHQVRTSQAWDFATKEGLCQYQNAVVCALYQTDPNFGQLMKSEGQNHCVDPAGRNCAVDCALYKPTGEAIDFVVSAGYGTPQPGNEVCWHVHPPDPEYLDKWFAPVDASGVTPPPDPDSGSLDEQILHLCEEMKLYLSNMNEQINLMAGEINNIRAAQNPPYAGPMVRSGDALTLHAQV